MRRLLASGPILIGVTVGLALGIIAGALYGRTSESANWVTAAATVALTAFALIQLLRMESDAADVRNQRRHRLEALATLARRSCEATVSEDPYYLSGEEWAIAVGSRFDPLEAQFLEIRSLAAGLSSEERSAARAAFDAFMSAADRVNVLGSQQARMLKAQAEEFRRDAVGYFSTAATALESISPKGPAEAALPRGLAEMMARFPPI